jgi:putative FmdB family regulatory protein
MPLYDYNCLNCNQRFDVFMTFSEYGTRPVACPHCKSQNVQRGIPRVRVTKSEDSRMESLAGDFSDPSALAGMENDPQAMGRMMRKMGNEMGEEIPPEFNEVVDRLEKGQSPEEIEKEIPDLGGDEMGGGDVGGGMDYDL